MTINKTLGALISAIEYVESEDFHGTSTGQRELLDVLHQAILDRRMVEVAIEHLINYQPCPKHGYAGDDACLACWTAWLQAKAKGEGEMVEQKETGDE